MFARQLMFPVLLLAFAAPASGADIATTQIDRAKLLVSQRLKDPSSAQFDSATHYKLGGEIDVVCGKVNAKNSYAAYTGTQQFVVINDAVSLRDERGGNSAFDSMWQHFCQSKGQAQDQGIATTALTIDSASSAYVTPQPSLKKRSRTGSYDPTAFSEIVLGATTPAEMEDAFGEPHTVMSLGEGLMMATWMRDLQSFAAVFEEGRFRRLQMVNGIRLNAVERKRLGL
ncbi:hypothetical protein [Lysobacter sp. Hz 25]|uniref:hypothetical protein n=1 Tax=Lysobacter sp. Hz 25 TaxID=3383698 RepID=UPI0038D3CCFD